MAKTLQPGGIATNSTIEAGHVTQSIVAFTGTEAYDITISGSLSVTGPTTLTGTTSGSFQGDGSGLTGVVSASFASTATSASYAETASVLLGSVTSASYAETASFAQGGNGIFSGSFSGSFEGDGSGITGVTGEWDGSLNGNASITGSLTVSGSNSVVNLQELQFDTAHSASGHSTGRMYWSDSNKTINLDMQGSDVVLQLGQEEHVYAKNTSGVTINNGDAVRVSGATGGNVTITKAISSVKSFKNTTEQDQILGIATEQILDNQSGYVTTFGAVRDLDTSTFSAGDILYLSNATSGSYTNIKPIAPNFPARIGVVQVSDAAEGVILARPSEPIFLTDIAQITSSGVITNEKTYLCYNDSTDLIEFTNGLSGSFSGSFEGDGSGITGVISSSYAETASILLGSVTSASYALTSSFAQSGNGTFSGSFSGSFQGVNTPTLQQVTDQGATTTNDITASANISMPTSNASIDMINGSILSRNGGSYPGIQLNSGATNNTIWFLSGNNNSINSFVTASFAQAGFIDRVSQIRARGNTSLLLQGGPSPNDANDGVKIETADASNVYQPRFQIESDTTNVDAYFTNINGLGINDSTPTAMLDVNGNINTTSNITASGNISSSGTVYGQTGSFSHLTGNSPITVTSPIISQLNSTKVIEVTHSGDFPTPVGTQITLEENTTYLIRGNVNMSDTLFASGSGISLYGVDRNRDTLTYTSSSTFLTVENSDFTIKDLKLSATNTSSLLISGSDYTSGSFNQGRDKVFEIVNSQFRNCGNVADFKGYDLIDINNTLFFYIQAPTIGVRFTDTSKTEISSCEFIRWYDETSNPSPSGYSTAPMIEFADTGSEGAGFGATNINGCIIHPQVQQDGIRIATGSKTSFGTIAANAFVNANLTTGSVFYPTNVQGLPDYSLVSTKKFDVFSNQGILNSTSGVVMTVTDNTSSNDPLVQNTPELINVGGNALNRASVRFEVSGSGRCTYIGSKQIYVSIHGSLSYQKQGAGTEQYTFSLYKTGTFLSGSELDIEGASGDLGTVPLNYGTLMNENDYIEVFVENTSGTDGMLVNSLQLVVRE